MSAFMSFISYKGGINRLMIHSKEYPGIDNLQVALRVWRGMGTLSKCIPLDYDRVPSDLN